MAIRISVATPEDDAAIRGLLRREPMPGRIEISYEREPDFSIGCEATGEDAAVLIAREVETGATVGVACRSVREVYVNSVPTRLGYLGQLRVDRRYRGRWLVSRGFGMLKQLHERDPLPGYLAAVVAANREAEGVLVQKPRKQFPSLYPMADYRTLTLRARRSTARVSGIAAAALSDVPEIIRFLRTDGARRQFFPVWTEPRLMALTHRLGLRIEDLQIARRRGGAIVGVIGVWDQSGYKQNIVRSIFTLGRSQRTVL